MTMKIDSLREPSGYDGRFTLVLDTGEKLRVERSVVADFGLYTGLELDGDTWDRLQEANRKASARSRAVRIVSASSVSKKELRKRLVHKGESEENADEAVAWLSELNLLDDLQTARQLAQSAARRGYGPARIRQIFYEKGIDKALWEEAMEDLPAPDDAIDRFLASRLKGRTPDQKELKRVIDALLRRGHRWSDIRPAVQRYTDALGDWIEEE